MSARIYTDKDVDLSWLKRKTCAVIGFGSQGRECLHELKFIVDLIHEAGISGMRDLISDTAKWGELTVGPKIIGPASRSPMRTVLRKIRSGKFAQEFICEMETGRKRYTRLVRAATRDPIEKIGRQLRRQMIWKNKNKRP